MSDEEKDRRLSSQDAGTERRRQRKVEQMQQAYDDDRPTAVLPGTDNTITGVAVNEWLDDDGNPKFGKDEQKNKDDEQNKSRTPTSEGSAS